MLFNAIVIDCLRNTKRYFLSDSRGFNCSGAIKNIQYCYDSDSRCYLEVFRVFLKKTLRYHDFYSTRCTYNCYCDRSDYICDSDNPKVCVLQFEPEDSIELRAIVSIPKEDNWGNCFGSKENFIVLTTTEIPCNLTSHDKPYFVIQIMINGR